MASGGHDNSPPPSTEHIQLQDLSSLPRRDHVSFENPGSGSTHVRTRSFGASIGRRLSMSHHQPGYDRLDNDSPQDTHHHHHLHIPTVQYEQPEPENRIADLDVPEYHYTNRDPEVYQLRREVDGALGSSVGRGSWLPRRNTVKKKAAAVEEGDATADNDNGDDAPWRPSLESDTAPLAEVANQQPMAGAEKRGPARFAPGPSLGVDMLSAAEMGLAGDEVRGTARSRSVRGGGGLSPSRSSSTAKAKRSLSVGAPVRRVSVALQNLGNRVINLGNDGVTIEQTLRRGGSAKSLAGSRATGGEGEPAGAETEKTGAAASATALPAVERPWAEQANPLKGNSLRIFSPSSRTRLILCDVLIHP